MSHTVVIGALSGLNFQFLFHLLLYILLLAALCVQLLPVPAASVLSL